MYKIKINKCKARMGPLSAVHGLLFNIEGMDSEWLQNKREMDLNGWQFQSKGIPDRDLSKYLYALT